MDERNYNDYYYRISSRESRKSGYAKYEAEDDFSPYLGLSTRINITEHFNVTLNGKAAYISGKNHKQSYGGQGCQVFLWDWSRLLLLMPVLPTSIGTIGGSQVVSSRPVNRAVRCLIRVR